MATKEHNANFWENQKEDVIAMMRQLRRPGFSLSLSQAQTNWPELIVQLKKELDKEDITEGQASALSEDEKMALIRRDAAICVKFFDNRVRALFKLLESAESPFSAEHKLVDYYIRLIFDSDGSAQVQSLLWLDNMPIFKNGLEDLKQCIAFIDKLTTCSSDAVEGDLLAHQIHTHSKACESIIDDGRTVCSLEFPIPPMPETIILTPMPLEKQTVQMKELAKKIDSFLGKLAIQPYQQITMTFKQMLTELKCTKAQYIGAVCCTMKKACVFLKRRPCEIMITDYNAALLKYYKAKIEMHWIQAIIKSEDYASELCLYTEKTIISPEEEAYYKLRKSSVRCSREFVFIDTSLEEMIGQTGNLILDD